MLPLWSRLGPVLALMMMAPVCAEHLTAYLPGTGHAVVLARVAVGFLAPLPPGVSPTAKTVQGVVLLVLALAVCRTAWVRARAGETSATVPA